MEEEIIASLLTKNEAKVYLSLLKAGSAMAGEITEKTGVHRRNVYDSIERLVKKGLVSHVNIDNKKVFSPANPERFLELMEEERRNLEKKKEDFRKILPSLKLFREGKKKQDVRFFRGIGGLKTVYEDILRTKKECIGYGSGAKIEEILKSYFRNYIKRRVKEKIKTRLIYEESERGKDYTKNPRSQVKFLPDKYSSHSSLRIYSDKTAIILMSKEDPLAIIIKNSEIADGYRKYFEILWKAAWE